MAAVTTSKSTGQLQSGICARPLLERALTLGRSSWWTSFFDAEGSPGPSDLESHTWKLGYAMGPKLFWEEFENQDAAEQRYRDLWWSKVLFDPAGRVVKCCTAALDQRGLGVAKLILAARRLGAACPVMAMEKGEAPFIPAERLPGLPQALQLLWDRFATRDAIKNSIEWFVGNSLCYFDVDTCPGVRHHVALTIDDVPCRLGPKNSLIPQVQELLKLHQAQATFMLMGKFIPGNEADLVSLLRDGHEFGNHGLVDKSYANDSREDFETAVDECSRLIGELYHAAELQQEPVKWFRAPHGKLSNVMSDVLREKRLTNVMCDTYACCPVIQDADFIGSFLGKQAEHGSIIVIHMPERGFRDWCLRGLEELLLQLRHRGLKAVSVGQLARLAQMEAIDPMIEAHL
eukprot:symbB.v1.2.000059.t1/scaffold2.1/size812218/13